MNEKYVSFESVEDIGGAQMDVKVLEMTVAEL
jgi:hypothetical protein